MDDLEHAILAGWDRVKSRVLSDTRELRKRLDRRTRPVLRRPPRTWCLALRAADQRLRDPFVQLMPPEATEPSYNNGHVARHDVTITTDSLLALCEPVTINGLTIDEAAARLGVAKDNLVHARVKGTLRSKYIEGLGGWWGLPRPILYADRPLDPTTRGFEPADAAWDWTGVFTPHRVPQDFYQTIVRIPLERPRTGGQRYRDTRGLHPEHPLLDPGEPPPRKSKRLPRPPKFIDVGAWYKWKGDEYIGYDWRNPYAKAGHERRERAKSMARAAHQRRRQASGPAPSRSKGSTHFQGWRWLCPRCERSVSTIYCPLPPVNLLSHWPSACAELASAGVELHMPQPAPTFACDTCHALRRTTPGCAGFWNQLIAFLTAGLLYGREVARPSWLELKRKLPYRPNRNARPALRRLAVQERLLKGWTYKRIAADLGIRRTTVNVHVRHIYKQHRVHGRAELARRLGVPPPKTKREQIRERLAKGETPQRIASAIGSSCDAVKTVARQLRSGAFVNHHDRVS